VVLLHRGMGSPINPSPVSSDAGNSQPPPESPRENRDVTPTPGSGETTTQPASVYAYHHGPKFRANSERFVGEGCSPTSVITSSRQPLASIDVPELLKRSEIIEARIRRFLGRRATSQARLFGPGAMRRSPIGREALAAEATSTDGGRVESRARRCGVPNATDPGVSRTLRRCKKSGFARNEAN